MGSNCYFCKKKLGENEQVCSSCGRRQVVTEELVNAARNDDQQAIAEIYMISQQNVFFTVQSMVKDNDTIADLVQDTFIKVFDNLDSLNFEEGKFQAWVRRIAHNTTVNYLRKKKEVLFSEMESDDSDGGIEFEDYRMEHLPDVVVDRDETSRLIQEMLATLSEEQRLTVGMHYYEQYSVSEIAEIMGVSENTVKSRLNYARKKIEYQVRDLEKKGTKLYGLSPIPFLLLLFRSQDAQAVAPDMATAQATAKSILEAKAAAQSAVTGSSVAAQDLTSTQHDSGSTTTQQKSASLKQESTSTVQESTSTVQNPTSTVQKTASAQQTSSASGNLAANAGKAAAATAGKGIAVKAAIAVVAVALVGGGAAYAITQGGFALGTGSASSQFGATTEELSANVESTEDETNTSPNTGRTILAADFVSGEGDNAYALGIESLLCSSVKSITFLDSLEEAADAAVTFDVSIDGDGAVLAWYTYESGGFDLYVAANGGISISEDTNLSFSAFTSMTEIAFNGCLDTSLLTDTSGMFAGCEALESVDLSSLDTSNVTDMSEMFANCTALQSVTLSGIDTSNVTNMSNLFYGCTALQSIELSGIDTANVTDMNNMFAECTSLTTVDLSSLDTSAATNMSNMFYNCRALTTLDVSNFNTANVTDMSGMFHGTYYLGELDLSGFDTSNVTTMYSMFFAYAEERSGIVLDLSSFNTSNVTDMSDMFCWCWGVTEIDVTSFDTSNVTTMYSMFYNCRFETIDLSSFNTANVTNMSFMFAVNANLQELDLSGFNTSNVTDMSYIFYDCYYISELGETWRVNMDNWDTSSVTNDEGMFDFGK